MKIADVNGGRWMQDMDALLAFRSLDKNCFSGYVINLSNPKDRCRKIANDGHVNHTSADGWQSE